MRNPKLRKMAEPGAANAAATRTLVTLVALVERGRAGAGRWVDRSVWLHAGIRGAGLAATAGAVVGAAVVLGSTQARRVGVAGGVGAGVVLAGGRDAGTTAPLKA